MPEASKFGAVVFPTFDAGVKFMEDLTHERVWPASCRVMDID